MDILGVGRVGGEGRYWVEDGMGMDERSRVRG